MDMKNITFQGGAFYPSRAANIGGDQTRSGLIHSFREFERESSGELRIEDGLLIRS
jgi:hypothetical protein